MSLRLLIGGMFLRLGERILGSEDERVEMLNSLRLEDLEDDDSPSQDGIDPLICKHPKSRRIDAPRMGKPRYFYCQVCRYEGE